jgi:carbon monoxide dehydrogenase subunit G
MHFENRATIPIGREALWNFLMDMEQVARCLPGVEEVRPLDQDNFLGILRLRVGPIGLRLEGKVSVTSRDRDVWRAAMRAEGSDKAVGGSIKATIGMTLHDLAPAQTELVVETDAQVLGRLGEFGQPVMRKKADSMMEDFARNVAQRATAGSTASS